MAKVRRERISEDTWDWETIEEFEDASVRTRSDINGIGFSGGCHQAELRLYNRPPNEEGDTAGVCMWMSLLHVAVMRSGWLMFEGFVGVDKKRDPDHIWRDQSEVAFYKERWTMFIKEAQDDAD